MVGSTAGASRYPRLETELMTQAALRKKIRVLPTRVEPMTFQLLVQVLYHRATEDFGN